MPNKKNVLLIIASITIVGGAFFIVEYKHGTTGQTVVVANPEKQVLNQITSDVSNKDTDGDGIKDWEETLWGLDPHTEDTGNTGVSDSKKLEKLKAQKLSGQNSLATNSSEKSTTKETKTDQFSKQFFTNYLEYRQAGGGNIDSATLAQITSQAAASVLTDTTANTYSLKSIKTFPDSDLAAVKNYANIFAQIRTKYQNQYSTHQISLPSEPNFTDPVLIKSFENAATIYKNLASELAKIPVPKSLAQTHVDILNAYIQSFRGLWAISATQKDPVSAVKGLGIHTEATNTENASLNRMSQYFKNTGITFTDSEPGNFWNSI